MKKYAPDLRAVFDVKQARLSGHPYEEYLADMAGNIDTVHLSDVDASGKIRLPGRGTFDFEKLFGRLSDVGFSGDMLIEVYTNDYGDVSEFTESLAYLRDLKKKVFG